MAVHLQQETAVCHFAARHVNFVTRITTHLNVVNAETHPVKSEIMTSKDAPIIALI